MNADPYNATKICRRVCTWLSTGSTQSAFSVSSWRARTLNKHKNNVDTSYSTRQWILKLVQISYYILPVVGRGDDVIINRGEHCRSEAMYVRIMVLQELKYFGAHSRPCACSKKQQHDEPLIFSLFKQQKYSRVNDEKPKLYTYSYFKSKISGKQPKLLYVCLDKKKEPLRI